MQELIVRDVRLLGGRPRGTEVLEVDDATPIDWPVLWTKTKSDLYKGDVYLRIAAHGYETAVMDHLPLATGTTTRVESVSYSQGGAGVQFCKENLTLTTLTRFSPLRGLLKGIDLLACGAAYITPGFEGREGDGNVLCSRLAQVTQTYVRASTATQTYYGLPTIDFGEWEGTVLTYGPSGAVVKVEHGDGVPSSCPIR
jgi:hypothetical protein